MMWELYQHSPIFVRIPISTTGNHDEDNASRTQCRGQESKHVNSNMGTPDYFQKGINKHNMTATVFGCLRASVASAKPKKAF